MNFNTFKAKIGNIYHKIIFHTFPKTDSTSLSTKQLKLVAKDCISLENAINDVPLSKLVENLGKFMYSIVLNVLIGFDVNVDHIRSSLECIHEFELLKGFESILSPLKYIFSNSECDMTLPCFESYVDDVSFVVGTLSDFLLQKDGYESFAKKEMNEIHAILTDEDPNLSVWTGKSSTIVSVDEEESSVEPQENKKENKKKTKKNKKNVSKLEVQQSKEEPKESQEFTEDENGNWIETTQCLPEVSFEIVNACMRCVVGLPCNNPTHSHSDKDFVYKIYGTVGLNECENGKECYFYNRRLTLADGRKTNCCVFGHGHDETKRSCAEGWALYLQGKITYDEIFIARNTN